MEGPWFYPQQSVASDGWRRRKKPYRVGGGASCRSIAAPAHNIGNVHLSGNYINVESDSTSRSDYLSEISSNSSKETSGEQISMQLNENIPEAAEIWHSSPSVIEKLMDLDDLPTLPIVPEKQVAIRRWGSTMVDKEKTNRIKKAFPNFQKDKVDLIFREKKFVNAIVKTFRTEEQSKSLEQNFSKNSFTSLRKRASFRFSDSLKQGSKFRVANVLYAGKRNSCSRPDEVVSKNGSLKNDLGTGSSILFPKQAQNSLLTDRSQSTRCRFVELHAKGRAQRDRVSLFSEVSTKTRRSRVIFQDVCGGLEKRGKMHDKNKLQPIEFDGAELKLPPEGMLGIRKFFFKESCGEVPEIRGTLDNVFSVSSCVEMDILNMKNSDLAQKLTGDVSTLNEEILCGYPKETSFCNPPLVNLRNIVGETKSQSFSSTNIKQSEQLSPTYVHEFPSLEDNTELCMHVPVAKSSSEDISEDSSEGLKLLDSNTDNLQSRQQNKDLEEFRDEEERDFSYLVDVLFESGVCGEKKRRLSDATYSLESGIGTDVFEKLEKKYNKLSLWPSSERRLFFDLVNSVLVENLVPCIYLHPWVNSTRKIGPILCIEGIVEKAWQILIRKRKELWVGKEKEKVLDARWLDIGDTVHEIDNELGRMLQDELLEELISEFILG